MSQLAKKKLTQKFLATLSNEDVIKLKYLWPVRAGHKQYAVPSEWTNWLMLGGRGAGKTRAGAEWVRGMVSGDPMYTTSPIGRLALVGETYSAVRDVMIEGESGILAIHPNRERPNWISSKRQLVWNNGAVAQVFTSEEPDGLRGPQLAAAWYTSKTIWGSLIAMIAGVGGAFGLDLDPQTQAGLVDGVLKIVSAAGSLLAIYGRFSATQPID